MQGLVARYAADENGTSAVQFALVASLVAVAIVGVLLTLGINLVNRTTEVADAIFGAGA